MRLLRGLQNASDTVSRNGNRHDLAIKLLLNPRGIDQNIRDAVRVLASKDMPRSRCTNKEYRIGFEEA